MRSSVQANAISAGVYMVGFAGFGAGGGVEELRAPACFSVAGVRLPRRRCSVELRGGAPASSTLANRRIRAAWLLPARFRAVADLDVDGSEDDDGMLRGGAEDPRRYPFGGGEWGLPGCQGAGSSILGVCTSSGSGASLSRHGCRRGRSPEGALCNFFRFQIGRAHV